MELPKMLLEKIPWSFIGEPYVNKDTLVQEVLDSNPAWKPDDVVLNHGSILIQYWTYEGGDQVTKSAKLAADDGKAFSAGELLFKLHNAVVQDLEEIDHHFLQGLKFNSHPVAGNPPVYVMGQGS